jgi:recombinational DNA repair ATPase RecF
MISSVAFRNFKALRSARQQLTPFNRVVGPNGSGKTSLLEAILAEGKRLRRDPRRLENDSPSCAALAADLTTDRIACASGPT